MKRHITNSGNRKWYSDHLTELQSESLNALDQFAANFGACVLYGCEIYDTDTTYRVQNGLVVLPCDDGKMRVMPYADNAAIDAFDSQQTMQAKKTPIYGEYENPTDTTIAYNYEAEIVQDNTGNGILIPASATEIISYFDKLNALFAQIYEPVIERNSAFNKDFGTIQDSVSRGNHGHSQYSLNTHNHEGVYKPNFTESSAFNKAFAALQSISENEDNKVMSPATTKLHTVFVEVTYLEAFNSVENLFVRMLTNGLIEIRGQVLDSSGISSNVIASLPPDSVAGFSYTPQDQPIYLIGSLNNSPTSVKIDTNGDITVLGWSSGAIDFRINGVYSIGATSGGQV